MLRTSHSRGLTRAFVAGFALLMMACDGSSEAPAGAVSPETLNAAAAEWRGKHEADYRRDWVSIAGLHL